MCHAPPSYNAVAKIFPFDRRNSHPVVGAPCDWLTGSRPPPATTSFPTPTPITALLRLLTKENSKKIGGKRREPPPTTLKPLRMVAPGRMVTSSRRIGRVTNKTKLIIYRGSDKVDTSAAETVLWDQEAGGAGKDSNKHQHIGATGVESGELLVRVWMCSFTFHYACRGVALGSS